MGYQTPIAMGGGGESEPLRTASAAAETPQKAEQKGPMRVLNYIQLDNNADPRSYVKIPAQHRWTSLKMDKPLHIAELGGDWAQTAPGRITFQGAEQLFDVRYSISGGPDPALYEQQLDVGLEILGGKAGGICSASQWGNLSFSAKGDALMRVKRGDTIEIIVCYRGDELPGEKGNAAGDYTLAVDWISLSARPV